MSGASDGLLRECNVFARYLIGSEPAPYVIDKYVQAHRVTGQYSTGTRFDSVLVGVARKHGTLTKLVDSYARVLAPAALVRRKLILLLAILETCAPSCHVLDQVERGTRVTLLAKLCARGLGSLASLVVGTVLLLPAHLILSAAERSRR